MSRTADIDLETYHRLLVERMTEKEWQAEVIAYLEMRGWLVYHTNRSTRSASGFPDLVAVRPPRVAFLELKREPTRRNKAEATEAQEMWLARIADCTRVTSDLYRPSDRLHFQEEYL